MKIIGRQDKIDIPELGLFGVEAKIDTGAFGCALHCHHIEIVRIGGVETLTFKVLDPSHSEYEDNIYRINNYDLKYVRSSSGDQEARYTFKTKIIIFAKSYNVEFSLTDRGKMKYPILIGRKFLAKRFLVDVQLKDLSFNKKI